MIDRTKITMATEISVYLDGTLRAIVGSSRIDEVMRIYPLLYPGCRIEYRQGGPLFDSTGRLIMFQSTPLCEGRQQFSVIAGDE